MSRSRFLHRLCVDEEPIVVERNSVIGRRVMK